MSDGILHFIRDFIVDFFGSFLPGLFLMFSVYVGVILPSEIYLACGESYFGEMHTACQIIGDLNGLASARWGAFLVSGIAYLIGLSYSKRPVDWADSASFYYNARVRSALGDDPFDPKLETEVQSIPETSWSRFCVYFIPEFRVDASFSEPLEMLPRLKVLRHQIHVYLSFKLTFSLLFAFGIPVKGLPRVMFPYNDLHCYLKSIGLETTANDVRWKRTDDKKKRAQFGMHSDYFNALKMRIQMAHSDKYHAIAYLEAQNRLLASMFYVASQAWLLICIFVMIVLAHIAVKVGQQETISVAIKGDNLLTLMMSSAIALLLCLFRHRILVVLHKERVREVVRVIDSATFLGSFDKAGVWKSRCATTAEKVEDTLT